MRSLLKVYLKFKSVENSVRKYSGRILREEHGQITVEQVLWIIFVVVILCGAVYGFVSGWFTGLLNSMKSTTDSKLNTIIS